MPRKGLLERIKDARPAGRKGFEEPPFWALDSARFPWGQAVTPREERIENDFEGYVNGAYKSDGVVFAAIDRRQQVFSQARFQWREFRNGQPGDLFGSPELALLEKPWPNGTTGEMLSYMEMVASLAGNAYLTTVAFDKGNKRSWIGNASIGKPGRRIARVRPDWTTLVIDAPSDDPFGMDAYVAGFLVQSRSYGGAPKANPVLLMPDEICHYSPRPDPTARFRGMSWLTPVIKEIQADKAATQHKLGFFERGATPSLVVKGIQATNSDQFNALVDMMEAKHAGKDNSYRTLYLSAGADAVPLGANLQQLDFRGVQGAGETRLAIAGGVPAAILGISEGLAGSSLNAGNFGAARRLFVDSTIRDLWAKAAASLQVLVTPPRSNASLWYDARDIPFLQEDAKDDADIRAMDAQTLRTLTDAGWKPDAAIEYVRTGDLKRLTGQHSGLFSVQLIKPGVNEPDTVSPIVAPTSMNGVPLPN